jgi:hypothetical protein
VIATKQQQKTRFWLVIFGGKKALLKNRKINFKQKEATLRQK